MTEEDRIRRTLAEYSQRNDTRDAEGAFNAAIRASWTELFTDDGRVVDRTGERSTRAELQKYIDGINARAPERHTEHLCGNVVIALAGDTAEADSDVLVCERFGDSPWQVGRINHYTDHLRRAESGWLIAERRIQARGSAMSRGSALLEGARLSPEEEVRRTLAVYAHLLDDRDLAGWSELFTLEATLSTARAELDGRPAIRSFMQAALGRQSPERRTEHFSTNPDIHLQGDVCEAVTDFGVYESFGDDAWRLHSVGRYTDQLVRRDRRWRFARRAIQTD